MGTAGRGRLVRRLRLPRVRLDVVAAAVVVKRLHDWPTIILLAVIVALTLFGYIDRRGVIDRNCRQLETVKQQIRETARFDPAALRQTLSDLNVDPDSDRGLRLTRQARHNSHHTIERFKPLDC